MEASESREFSITGVDPEEKKDRAARQAREAVSAFHWVEVVEGEHKGQKAAYIKDEGDGRALIRFRDHNHTHDYTVVPFEHLAPTHYTGGR